MSTWLNDLIAVILIGTGATAAVDLWALVRRSWFGIALPNYGLVGRWVAHMRKGTFCHDSIASSPVVRGEVIVGWATHYLIGVAFAALLVGIWGSAWLHQPKLIPALIVGIGTVLAPFLLMQPGMGAGVASSRSPQPGKARMQSLITHAIFGVGLYASGWLVHTFNFN